MAPSIHRPIRTGRLVAFATAYDNQADDEQPTTLEIPEDLSTLDDEALGALLDQFVAAGAALYSPDEGIIPDAAGMETLRELAAGAETLRAAQAVRATEAAGREAEAADLAAQLNPVAETETEGEGETPAEGDGAEETPAEGDGTEEAPATTEGEGGEEETPEALAASGRRSGPTRISLPAVRSRQSAPRPRSADAEPTIRDFITIAPNAPLHGGAPADFAMVGASLSRQLASFPESQYAQAAARGQQMRQTFGLATIRKPFDPRLVVREDASMAQVEAAMDYAVDERRLPGESLLASGGWCAPFETLFDLFEIETTDGIYSLPEINIQRSGVQWTPGPTFSEIFAAVGFSYSAANDEAGDYGVDANGVGNGTAGSKPCYHVECADFDDAELSFDGLCITAGLLQRKAYPEIIQRVLRGALVAHAHKMGAHYLTAVANGSTHVTMPADQVGTAAPVLTAIELQVAHLRALHRTQRNMVMEAVFPEWAHGAIRSDLSRRLGVPLDALDVDDPRIDGWFRRRGVNPQFVYGLNDIATTAASGFTQWPTSLDFLLYPAGTWVKGGSAIITLDTIYDSQLLGTNDYTALFSEEGWLVAKRGHDSRRVTVNICPDGATHAGVAIDCDGSTGA